ncbi:MAG TPA: hypothetical protein VFU73_14230 [Actinocrinis sp.]|nr:hypothetical protein [Actinocrinis sp.]
MSPESKAGSAAARVCAITVGYDDTEGTESQVACPPSLTITDARGTATRQIAEQVDAGRYDTTIASGAMTRRLARPGAGEGRDEGDGEQAAARRALAGTMPVQRGAWPGGPGAEGSGFEGEAAG